MGTVAKGHHAEELNTLLRALGNHGHDDLLGIAEPFHAHKSPQMRAVAAHVLRRVRHVDTEARLLSIVQLDDNETAQIGAANALMHFERDNSAEVAKVFEDCLMTMEVSAPAATRLACTRL